MARGRKSSKVKVITGRDRDLMMQLSKTGLCNSMQAKKHCGVSMERLKKLEKAVISRHLSILYVVKIIL